MSNENRIYDEEKTLCRNLYEEQIQLADVVVNKEGDVQNDSTKEMWHRTAVGLGAGIVVGAAGTILTSGVASSVGDAEQNDGVSHPAWVDDQVPVATKVTEDMSFVQAFETARSEVGSGGVFQWQGNIYSTYTEGEWNTMTAEERAEYGAHFNWNQSTQPTDDNGVEVVYASGQHNNASNNVLEQVISGNGFGDREVEILGVVHDEETDSNIGEIVIDGQNVYLIDVDNDLSFDVMAADLNKDGQLTSSELVDISDQGITVEQIGGFSSGGTNHFVSTDDGIDYMDNENVYEI